MKGRDLFGVAIRLMGLYMTLISARNLCFAVRQRLFSGFSQGVVLYEVLVLFVGLCLLRGAPWVMKFSYPEKKADREG